MALCTWCPGDTTCLHEQECLEAMQRARAAFYDVCLKCERMKKERGQEDEAEIGD